MYTYLWEYRVRPEAEARFRGEYGPDGAWVALFRRAPGYVSTRLYRDRDDGARYVTADTWETREAHDAFRRRFAEEFAELDAACETFTLREVCLGHFEDVTGGEA